MPDREQPGRRRRSGRIAREIRGVRGLLAGHDLMLYAAGATFYLAVAYVPLLLMSVRLAALLTDRAHVAALGEHLAALLPTRLHARASARGLIAAGLHAGWLGSLAGLVPGSLYGEGLRRALARLDPAHPPVRAWRGRLGTLALVALSPIAVLGVLSLTAALTQALGTGWWARLLGIYLAFLVAWLVCSFGLLVVYGVLGPGRHAVAPLAWAAFGAGSCVAGFALGFLLFLHLPIRVGTAYGGLGWVAVGAVVAGWGWLLHLLVLIGYAVLLRLEGRGSPGGPGQASPEVGR